MKDRIEELAGDPRPVLYAERLDPDPDNERFCWSTKEGRYKNCDEIRPYWENGEMAGIPWLAIIKDGTIIARCAARYHEIGYSQEGENDNG
jgi:hypothetical protein